MSLTQLSTIKDVTLQYGVTSRTLRYYEEIGLLESNRGSITSKRFYTQETLRKLEMILLLKQLHFSMKEIHAILQADDMLMTIRVFVQKLKDVKNDIVAMMTLQKELESILALLRQKGYSKEKLIERILGDSEKQELGIELIVKSNQGKNKEDKLHMDQTLTRLQDHEVRFLELKPMKVAYYHTVSNQPEDEAWNVLYAWVKERGLDQKSTTRYFGFNRPGKNQEHGYEMWATVTDEIEPSGEVQIKQFDGGLYAVSSLYGYDIPEAWKRLNSWVKNSKYQANSHQGLEEHFLFNGNMFVGETFQLDIYYPVSIKE